MGGLQGKPLNHVHRFGRAVPARIDYFESISIVAV
ncbi:hypothetical protein ACVWZ4_004404 [Bradyrhizobium sp. USDA 4472]